MSDKTEIKLPKAHATGDHTIIGDLRFQEYDKDEIHVHDDQSKLVFVYKGKRSFQIGMDEFIKTNTKHVPGTVLVVRGDAQISSSGGQPADLILTRTDARWEIKLEPAGSINGTVLLADRVISHLDDFINRMI